MTGTVMTRDQEATIEMLQAKGYRPQSPERIPYARGAVSVVMAGRTVAEVALRIEADGKYATLTAEGWHL